MSLSDEITADAPVAWWPLDVDARDRGSLGLHGTVIGSVIAAGQIAPGVTGSVFDGSTGYIQLPDLTFDFSQGCTLEAIAVYINLGYWSRILDFGNGTGQANLALANTYNSGDLWFGVYGETSGSTTVTAGGVLQRVAARHVVAVADPVGDQLRLYINGVLVNTAPFTGTVSSIKRTKNYIGKANWTNETQMNGGLAQVAVYNKVLTAQRIVAHAATLAFIKPTSRMEARDARAMYSANVMPAAPPGQKGYNPYIGLWDVYDGGHGQVHGKVTTEGAPAHRKVRLLNARDGRILRERWSEQDGRYDFPFIAEDRDYVALAHDHLAQFNAVVADRVRAEPMP